MTTNDLNSRDLYFSGGGGQTRGGGAKIWPNYMLGEKNY